MGRQTTRKPLCTQSQSLSTISRQPVAGAPPEYCSEHHKSPMAISSSPSPVCRQTSGNTERSQGGTDCSCSQVFNAREGLPGASRTRSPPCLVDTLIGGGVVCCSARATASSDTNQPGQRTDDPGISATGSGTEGLSGTR